MPAILLRPLPPASPPRPLLPPLSLPTALFLRLVHPQTIYMQALRPPRRVLPRLLASLVGWSPCKVGSSTSILKLAKVPLPSKIVQYRLNTPAGSQVHARNSTARMTAVDSLSLWHLASTRLSLAGMKGLLA